MLIKRQQKDKNVRKLYRVLAPVAVIAVGTAGIVALNATAPKPDKKEETVRSISMFVEPVISRAVTLTVSTQGEVRPKTEIDLISQVSGRIKQVDNNFVDGGSFKAGQSLVKVEDEDYQYAVTIAESTVAEATAQFARTRADANIVAKQWEKWVDGIPTDLALRKPQVAQATAKLKAAEANRDKARLNLKRTKISVPFTGRIRSKSVDIGQYVSLGTKIGRVFATDVVEIRLPLSDHQLSTLNLPMAFQATSDNAPRVILSATLADKTYEWEGKLVRTAAAIDPQTRMLYAVAEVKDPYGAAAINGMPLAVGLFVNATIEGRAFDNGIVMPRAALRAGSKAYVVTDDNKLSIREVTILSSSPDGVIIGSGVESGERVVISPVRTAINGMAVQALSSDGEIVPKADSDAETEIVSQTVAATATGK